MSDHQSEGRKDNGAAPGGKPTPDTPDHEVKQTGERARRAAGPDGPDAEEVGDTFKKRPG